MSRIEGSELYYIIYQTTNILNNKIYIGMHKTSDLNDKYLGSGKLLNLAIQKYGRDNFTRKILFVFDNEKDMRLKESEIVTPEFIARKDTYNLTTSGRGGFYFINTNKNKSCWASLNGKKASHEVQKSNRQRRISIYNQKPKLCKTCKKKISYDKRYNTYCSSSCSPKWNKGLSKLTSELLYVISEKNRIYPKNFCLDCKKEISHSYKRCKNCSIKFQKKKLGYAVPKDFNPNKPLKELQDKYKVSHVTIYKWKRQLKE